MNDNAHELPNVPLAGVMPRAAPIGAKLRWLSIISSATALIAASLVLLFVQVAELREGIVRRYATVADLLAFNLRAAVDFDDPDSARATLASLATRPEVVSAGIVVRGELFAAYDPAGASRMKLPEAIPETPAHVMTDYAVTTFRPITARGQTIGVLYVQSTVREIARTRRRFAWITLLVAIPALLVAIIVSHPIQGTIARPILALATLARTVSATKNYSIRAPAQRTASEIEQLVATFNHMLSEIERQHAEIEDSRALLERRVEERTAELEQRARELEEKRQELAVANQELESFSYSVSHDLRAPLRAIDGFSKVLMNYEGKVLDERGVHYLARVRTGTQKMGALIDDMLHLSRVSRHAFEETDVDLTSIAEQIAAELARTDPDRKVSWVIDREMRASADPHLVTIALNNLLGNAWKFTRGVPEACIEVRWDGPASNGNGTVFHVRDNGAGFDMTYANKLFAPFQRLHTEAEFEGTGIGLATVKRVISRHGGAIWAESAEGAGATFHFTLGGKG
jgi:signal transduction histidine kinase